MGFKKHLDMRNFVKYVNYVLFMLIKILKKARKERKKNFSELENKFESASYSSLEFYDN